MSVFAFGDLLHSVLGINLLKNDEKSKTWTQKRVFRALRNFENCNNFVLIEIRMKFDTGKCLGSITFRKKCTSGVTLMSQYGAAVGHGIGRPAPGSHAIFLVIGRRCSDGIGAGASLVSGGASGGRSAARRASGRQTNRRQLPPRRTRQPPTPLPNRRAATVNGHGCCSATAAAKAAWSVRRTAIAIPNSSR